MQPDVQPQQEPPAEPDASHVAGSSKVLPDDVLLAEAVNALGCPKRKAFFVWVGIVLLLALLYYFPELVATLAGIAAMAAVPTGVARWVVGPLDRAAKQIEARGQFTLADFLCLFFLVQMPMALIHGLLTDEEQEIRWIMDIYAWFAFGAVWLVSVRRLSRAGIHRTGPRALFLTFVLPSAVFGVVAALPLAFGGVLLLVEFIRGNMLSLHRSNIGPAVGGAIALVTATCVSGLITRRIVAAAAAEAH